MKLVLSEKEISCERFPEDVRVVKIKAKDISGYDGNSDVVAIAGSRGLAIRCAQMNFPSLKLFQLTSAGFDNVPLEKFSKKNIFVANAGSVYSVPIAETVVFGILQMAKKVRKNPNNRHFKLTRGYNTITELADKKVLIMGAGNIGTAVAERLSGFEMKIWGYDPYCEDKEPYEKILKNREELNENISSFDYIVSTLPDNNETKGFINKEIFSLMKKSAVIVNVGRKAVFNKEDFLRALKTKEIGGAVLDMFEKLPNPITNPFRRLDNVIVLPGVAAISREVKERLRLHITDNVLAMINGDKISYVINERR